MDRDTTTIDAAFGRILDLGYALGETGSGMVKAVDQFEKVKDLIFRGAKKVDQLPKPDRPKRISKPASSYDEGRTEMDGEIPF